MVRYLWLRVLSGLLTVWMVATLTFALMHLVPGGPSLREKVLPAAVRRNVDARYGLDLSLPRQYADYLGGLVRGDLESLHYPGRTVRDIIHDGFPVSATVGVLALLLAVPLGVAAGVAAALRRGCFTDRLITIVASLGYSIPSYVVAALLLYLLAYRLGWLPAALWGTPAHVVMPALTLAAGPAAFIARQVRAGLIEALSQEYARVALAKGLTFRTVVLRHALRNALLPVVTYLGPAAAAVLTGSFVVEQVFAVPGLGREFVRGALNRDYGVIMGTGVFYTTLLVGTNLFVDLAYGWLDPRIRLVNDARGAGGSRP